MTLDLLILSRAAELAAASEFPDADPRLFFGRALREIVMGGVLTAPVEDDAHTAWSVAQHVRRAA